MKVRQKEGKGFHITINLDKKNHSEFVNELKLLGQKYESNSNVNKLDYSIVIHTQRNPFMSVKGWADRCEDFKFVIFSDWDDILFWQVKVQLEMLMERYNLSPFYVFETASDKDCSGEEYGNYIAISLTKRKFSEVFNILGDTTCDQAHRGLPAIYRFKSRILRLSGKGNKPAPKFKCVVGALNEEYSQEISSAHLKLLKEIYPEIPDIKYTNPDKLTKVWLSEYKTASK